MRCRVILEKKFSTALSQEAEVGVKWKVQRGWRASQASTLGCFVRGIVVKHRVDHLAGRDLALDGIEKADEFEVAVALHAAPDDGAVEHAERGEQGGGAMPLVIVRHGLAAAGFDRQPWLRAIE